MPFYRQCQLLGDPDQPRKILSQQALQFDSSVDELSITYLNQLKNEKY